MIFRKQKKQPYIIILGMLAIVVIALSFFVSVAQEILAQGPGSTPPPNLDKKFWALSLPANIKTQQAQIASQKSSSLGSPPWNHTSDYLLGTVSVAIILPECAGSNCTESWTTTEINQVKSEIEIGLQWWQQKATEANASVQFQIVSGHPLKVPISVEPINIPGGDDRLCGNEEGWIDEVMQNLGYNAYPNTNDQHLNEVREYDDDLRQTNGTDWALTIFVADASNDDTNDPVDGVGGQGLFRFTTCNGAIPSPGFGVAAYAWIGGPHIVMNNVNNGFRPQFIDGVVAHEIGHSFGAPDELPSLSCNVPGQGPSCNTTWGYLNVANGNCNYDFFNNPGSTTCTANDTLNMMRIPEETSPGSGIIANTLNIFTKDHIGWRDTNSNGIPDTLDTIPSIQITQFPSSPTTAVAPTYLGNVQDNPLTTAHPDYVNLSINDVWVEFRVNGGSWSRGVATDGMFDSPNEAFSFSPLFCQSGSYNIEAQAVNSVGNTSNLVNHTIVANPATTCKTIYLPVILKSGTNAAAYASQQPSTFTSPINPSTFTSPPPLPAPKCQGQSATVWVYNNIIQGGSQPGQIYLGELVGTNGNDVIVGTDEPDAIYGSAGHDLVCGRSGKDIIHGNEGDDTLFGENGKDIIYGDEDNDNCTGGNGNDEVDCEVVNE